MGYASCLRGIRSGAEYPPDTVMNLDPVDNRPVEIVLDVERIRREKPDGAWYHPERKDMWRFGSLLPLDIADPDDARHIVTLGEGYTPLLAYPDHDLAKKAGFRLQVKEEGRAYPGYGRNPTQSFKDRGMAMAVSMARRLGLKKLAVPTQGNAGDALAEYGRAAGLEVAIVMPDDTPMPILGKVAAYAQIYPSVHLELVKGTIREAGLRVKERYLPEGYFSVATFQEPGWRIEGKKTMGLELAEPAEPGGAWSLPDVIVYPTGGGTGILGMWKAFDELEALGLIDGRRPRIVSVQSARTAPLVRAFEAGLGDAEPVQAGDTLATGLNVPGGVGHFRVLEILYASEGCALGIEEAAIEETLRHTFKTKGWWISPEGAAGLAALPSLVDRGVIRAGDRVVTFNTGSFEKYLPNLRHLLRQDIRS
ncbi:MAG: threonine synthase [Rhodothermales bacterium]